ncbi:hypothetical protein MRY87_12120 [bacterium]|nr:hypothetical protein [bacterium]
MLHSRDSTTRSSTTRSEPPESQTHRLDALQHRADQALARIASVPDTEPLEDRPRAIPAVRDRSQEEPKLTIAFFGFPGTGKSTQGEHLCRFLKTRPFHLGRFSKSIELPEDERARVNEQRQRGQVVTGLTERFLETAENSTSSIHFFDGFPRSSEDAEKLLEFVASTGSSLRVFYLHFPDGECVRRSLISQIARHRSLHGGAEPSPDEIARYFRKIERTIEHDLAALGKLSREGVAIHRIPSGVDRDNGEALVSGRIHEQLGDDLHRIHLLEEPLQQIEECLRELSIPQATASCGLFYRTFFNGQYGPPRLPIDLHVGVRTQDEATRLQSHFREKFPSVRFKARPIAHLLELQLEMSEGTIPADPEQAQLVGPCVWLQGGILLEEGKRTFIGTESAFHCLRAGILQVDEELLGTLPEDKAQQLLSQAAKRALALREEYPALKLQGALEQRCAELLGESLRTPSRLLTGDWAGQAVREAEARRGGKSLWSTGITADELPQATEVQQLLRTLPHFTEPIPIPPQCSLPGVLAALQEQKRRCKDALEEHQTDQIPAYRQPIEPPRGEQSWSGYLARTASDGEWREWLLNQTKSKHPFGGSDEWLTRVLHLEQEELAAFAQSTTANRAGQQKPTHQGTPLRLHLLWTGILLETDHLMPVLTEAGFSESDRHEIRMGLRAGTLAHDIGKVANEASIDTPGVHEVLGLRVWPEIKPEWLGDQGDAIARWCIEHHDIFGRLARGLSEKETDNAPPTAPSTYRGAMDPTACRAAIRALPLPPKIALELAKAVWVADVGSVQSLRWLLPAAEPLKKLVEIGLP